MSGESNEPSMGGGGANPLHCAAAPPESEPIYVTDLTPNDILLGRGAPIINYEGNVRFRDLVRTRKKEYVGTGRHQLKDDIARQIIEEIVRRKGRFLRKVNPHQEDVSQLQLTGKEKVWRVAEEDVAIEKVKQALRDKEPVKPAAQPTHLAGGGLPDGGLLSSINNNSNNVSNAAAAAARMWGDMAAAQGLATAGFSNTAPTSMLSNAPVSFWNSPNAGVVAAAAGMNNNMSSNFNDVAAATMGMMQPSDQLAFMLQQTQQDFMRQQQLNILHSQLMRNQQIEQLQRQQLQQQQQQNTIPQQQASLEAGGVHQQLLQQISSSPNGQAILAALQAGMGQQQQQNQHLVEQQIQLQQQLQQQQMQQLQQGPSIGDNNIQHQDPQHQNNQISAKAAVSESSESNANQAASSSSSGTEDDDAERNKKRKADSSVASSEKRDKL